MSGGGWPWPTPSAIIFSCPKLGSPVLNTSWVALGLWRVTSTGNDPIICLPMPLIIVSIFDSTTGFSPSVHVLRQMVLLERVCPGEVNGTLKLLMDFVGPDTLKWRAVIQTE